jgi:hypothetical protein
MQEKIRMLNNIKNNSLIKISSNWDFTYTEEKILIDSPVKSYYYKYDDLSINLLLKLKWGLYGYFFFKSIIDTLDDPINTKDIIFEEEFKSKKKEFFLDDFIIENFDKFKSVCENEYTKEYYGPNSTIRLKIKLSAKEFIILQNILFPHLVQFIE